MQESIADVDKSIGKIDAFGTGMREAGQKIANTFRTFADKPEKEYGEKKYENTRLIAGLSKSIMTATKANLHIVIRQANLTNINS